MSNVNDVLNNVGSNSLSLFHCNICSLPKNLTLLNDLIYTLDSKPDVLACTETRLNNDTIENISLPGYNSIIQIRQLRPVALVYMFLTT